MGAGSWRALFIRIAAAACVLVLATPTTAPAVVLPIPKMTFGTPRIAARKWDPVAMSGTISGVKMNPKDRLVIKLYHWETGRWKFVRDTTPSRKRISTYRARWWTSIRAGGRGQFRCRAVVRAFDGRYQLATSRWVRFRAVSNRYIALTFDDGSWSTTDRVRSALDGQRVKATFFMIGRHTSWNRGAAKRVAAGKHQIANHTQNHRMLASCSNTTIRRELTTAQRTIRGITGQTPTWYRPPGGSTNSRVRRVARGVGLREMMWTVDTGDWRGGTSSSTIRRRAVRSATTGGVILMHDGGGNRSATARAVPGIVRDLDGRGYDFVTLNEWAAIRQR